MERLSERLTAIEAVLKKLEPVEGLLERVALLENTIYTTKKVFTFQEACMYIGVSESMLYKLTSNKMCIRDRLCYLPVHHLEFD